VSDQPRALEQLAEIVPADDERLAAGELDLGDAPRFDGPSRETHVDGTQLRGVSGPHRNSLAVERVGLDDDTDDHENDRHDAEHHAERVHVGTASTSASAAA
jgi:hypothetical protein